MALVCPQCKQVFEKPGVCPMCNAVLLYYAPDLTPPEPASTPQADDEPSQWQQTPWGKIVAGLVLAQGLNFGLQQLLTAGLLASDSSEVWDTVLGLILHHAILGISLLIGGALSGAAQERGIIYGAAVGLVSGIISLFLRKPSAESFASMLVYMEPVIRLATGALGGAIGMLIWRPTPPIPELDGNTPVETPLPSIGDSLGNLFHGPVHFGRICAGAFVVVIGVVWATAIFDFLLRASNGNLAVTSKLQAKLISMEISALVALVGAALAGATTNNGFKQGFCVGLAASAIVLGMQISNPTFTLEAAAITIGGIIVVSMVGGWFGSQLFPPYDPNRRKKRLAYE